jgi:D-tyrosyl-tRNA(Tyr) deacylase
MRFLIQVVANAEVKVDGEVTGKIDKGFLVFIGLTEGDTKELAEKMVRKMLNLRIFADENGKTNLSLSDVSGGVLAISQFTLYADCRKGNRPNFLKAMKPQEAEELYEYCLKEIGKTIPDVGHGIFGADMKVSLLNDGPFTIILDSEEIF